MIHLNTYITNYGRKKGQESKFQFDSQSLKVGNQSELRACRGVSHIFEKILTRVIAFL
jgi:hypothetical protein